MTAHRARTVGWLAVLAQFAAIGLILLATGTRATSPAWLWAIGLGCILVGIAVLAVAFLNLGGSLTPTPVPNGSGLRTSGLYRWIRHPIYTGLLLIMLGVVLRSIGWLPVLAWLLLLVILTAKARWEERLLSAAYPDYTDYMKHTNRFLPGL